MKYLVANWKMNPSSLEKAKELFYDIEQGVKDLSGVEMIVCPPFVYLSELRGETKLGAQDCFWEQEGAFTGEISPKMLKNMGCEYVILGHSERRQHLRETDEMIGKKLETVLQAGLIPILCIGETAEERSEEGTQEILKKQLDILHSIPDTLYAIHPLIAYEPRWTIGTGDACPPDKAKNILSYLRKWLSGPILYGGSVNPDNAGQYIDTGFDGLLIGNVSLDAEKFVKISKILDKI